MIPVSVVIALVWMHTFADFFLQNDKMAISKSTSNKWLAIHVLVYSIIFFVFGSWEFVVINFIAHFITDYISSRATSALWKANKRHWFFVVIGVDQAVHFSTLFLTYYWLF